MVRTHGDDPILAAAAAKGLKDAERKGRVIKLLEETRKVRARHDAWMRVSQDTYGGGLLSVFCHRFCG